MIESDNNYGGLGFQEELQSELKSFLNEEKNKFPEEEVLRIDLHCHDYNSDVPDELLGRILNVPETWLETERLMSTLRKNKVDVITITNHNNARSCWEQKNQGVDVLSGAEFSCMVPDFNIGIHVLAYGFDRDQERILIKLRNNLYNFLRFARSNDIPTIWAHPLYFYKVDGIPPMDFFNKMACVFERFEVLNGQRDTWQNLLVKTWLDSLSKERIDDFCDRYNINPNLYCLDPYKKSFSGGSDSHMGIFAGQTGSLLHVSNLKEKLKSSKRSDLALEAIRNGNIAPYGNHQNFEKLTIAFLDYVCQIAMFKKDPGLMRILLHKGTARDKLLALFVNNAFAELSRHKVTMRFIELFHNCFKGVVPSKSQRIFISKDYKPVFDDAITIAQANELPAEEMIGVFNETIQEISNKLNQILFERLEKKFAEFKTDPEIKGVNINEIIEKLEIPSELRTFFDKNEKPAKRKGTRMMTPDVGGFLDGLSFPFLASSILLGANFTSAKVMYNNRSLLKLFSERINKFKHPERILWLTDTFEDRNGVSVFLQNVHKEIKRRNLPIDILVCSGNIQPDEHLNVVKPLGEFNVPGYENQAVRVPSFMEIHQLFLQGEYDRIICSTEGFMGLVGLYLKNAYSVKAYFYMHTDWIMFARKVLKLDEHNLNRARRFLRAYYKAFDGVFVLNSDHRKWLTGTEMGFEKSDVFLTAHWTDEVFKPTESVKKQLFNLKENSKILLFAGRVSGEKGVMEIPQIYAQVKETIPDLKMVFAGTGPAEDELKQLMPEAIFMGWVEHEQLPKIYSSSDILILPSKFDTFSCVVLEAMSCGLPVIAYNAKGPKDIIDHMKNGYLALTKSEMAFRITEFFRNDNTRKSFRLQALEKAEFYNPEKILDGLMLNVELSQIGHYEKTKV